MEDFQNRLQILKALMDGQGAEYQILEHEITLATAGMGPEHGVGDLSEMAPTIILKTEKGFIAAVISGDSRLLYKKVKKELGLKDVSLASPELVREATGAEIGYVSMINEGMETIIDGHLLEQAWACGGCGVPKTTLKIRPRDLAKVTEARVFDFTERKAEA